MKPDPKYSAHTSTFWAAVRYVSQEAGYATKGAALAHEADRVRAVFIDRGLAAESLSVKLPSGETLADAIVDYLGYRARVLNDEIRDNLMDAAEAATLFDQLGKKLKPSCPLPMNKQKGEKRTRAFLTCIVNMLVQRQSAGCTVDYDPHSLVLLTRDNRPEVTLSRRFDGCFPSTTDPIAVWEIKEYYYATTFGSRVADGVYESLLDGLELRDAELALGRRVGHYLFLDGKLTWWQQGKSYLCRIVDMMNMGLVDEVLVGREVVDRLPGLVEEWCASVK